MKNNEVIISGLHMELTAAIKNLVEEKTEKLFAHEARIQRIRVELEYNENKGKGKNEEFIAKGHIEISGPPLIVSEATEDLHKSIDLMVDKLDRKLRRRSRLIRVKRKMTKEVEIPAQLPKVNCV